jgi:hypothetical protein
MSNLSRTSFESRTSSSSDKKCVSFNNQVIRNTFKTGSTVAGMRKPGHSSKKKNKRKRTVSDPSHDSGADAVSLKENSRETTSAAMLFRSRSVSESSDDNSSSGGAANESESVNDEDEEESSEDAQVKSQQSEQGSQQQKQQQSNANGNGSAKNKKKKKKNNNNKAQAPVKSGKEAEPVKNPFTVDTMLDWKNTGRLGNDDANAHATKCTFNFKNKIIDQLD